jgi:hypothetical protein
METEIAHGAEHRRLEQRAAALIVRCGHCGKESRYLPSEINDFPKMGSYGLLRSRAAGTTG